MNKKVKSGLLVGLAFVLMCMLALFFTVNVHAAGTEWTQVGTGGTVSESEGVTTVTDASVQKTGVDAVNGYRMTLQAKEIAAYASTITGESKANYDVTFAAGEDYLKLRIKPVHNMILGWFLTCELYEGNAEGETRVESDNPQFYLDNKDENGVLGKDLVISVDAKYSTYSVNVQGGSVNKAYSLESNIDLSAATVTVTAQKDAETADSMSVAIISDEKYSNQVVIGEKSYYASGFETMEAGENGFIHIKEQSKGSFVMQGDPLDLNDLSKLNAIKLTFKLREGGVPGYHNDPGAPDCWLGLFANTEPMPILFEGLTSLIRPKSATTIGGEYGYNGGAAVPESNVAPTEESTLIYVFNEYAAVGILNGSTVISTTSLSAEKALTESDGLIYWTFRTNNNTNNDIKYDMDIKIELIKYDGQVEWPQPSAVINGWTVSNGQYAQDVDGWTKISDLTTASSEVVNAEEGFSFKFSVDKAPAWHGEAGEPDGWIALSVKKTPDAFGHGQGEGFEILFRARNKIDTAGKEDDQTLVQVGYDQNGYNHLGNVSSSVPAVNTVNELALKKDGEDWVLYFGGTVFTMTGIDLGDMTTAYVNIYFNDAQNVDPSITVSPIADFPVSVNDYFPAFGSVVDSEGNTIVTETAKGALKVFKEEALKLSAADNTINFVFRIDQAPYEEGKTSALHFLFKSGYGNTDVTAAGSLVAKFIPTSDTTMSGEFGLGNNTVKVSSITVPADGVYELEMQILSGGTEIYLNGTKIASVAEYKNSLLPENGLNLSILSRNRTTNADAMWKVTLESLEVTQTEDQSTTAVTGVTLDKNEMTLTVGESGQLTAVVAPEDATNKGVTFASSDETVATVDENGKVTAVKAGSATITVTTEDGGKTATCTITVNEAQAPAEAGGCSSNIASGSVIIALVVLAGTVGILFIKTSKRSKR